MFKITPNPPEADPTSPYTDGINAQKLDAAAKRALDFYLRPKPEKPEATTQPGQLFTVVEDVDTECLLANLSETLASADAMVSDLAFELDGSPPRCPWHSAIDRAEFVAGKPGTG